MAQKDTDIIVKSDIEAAIVETVQPNIESLIYVIRGKQVMMDSDLAMLYQVETGNLNKSMKRNQKRFLFSINERGIQ